VKFNALSYDLIIKMACEVQAPTTIHQFYKRMIDEGIVPSSYVFLNILKFYKKKRIFSDAKYFFMEAEKYYKDDYVYVVLVDLFAEIASFTVPFKDVFELGHFNAFFSAYLKTNFAGLTDFIKYNPTEQVLYLLVRHFCKTGNIDLALKYAAFENANINDIHGCLVDFYHRTSKLDEMVAEYLKMVNPPLVITTRVAQKLLSYGSPLISSLPTTGIENLIEMYAKKDFVLKMAEQFPYRDPSLNTGVLECMVQFNFQKACDLYAKLALRPTTLVITMLNGYIQNSTFKKTIEFYKNTPENFRMSLQLVKYLFDRKDGNINEILSELKEIQLLKTMSSSAWSFLISVCVKRNHDPTTLWVMMKRHQQEPNIVIYNLLIEFYCKNDQIDKAIGVLNLMRTYNVVLPTKASYLMVMKYYMDRDMTTEASKIYSDGKRILGEEIDK
jgi:pentatricopeptide repeat protein